jgi:uncharacterized protein YdhG (YjbR/CyaY superfamily)
LAVADVGVIRARSRPIDEYIASCPPGVRPVLQSLRRAVHEEAPDAVEVISYRMPAFKVEGRILIYFAAWKKHIGIYPPVSEAAPFKQQLARYEGPKGNLQLPLDEPMPMTLVRKVVRFRAKECHAAARAKRKPART